jgi:hypothetical protein
MKTLSSRTAAMAGLALTLSFVPFAGLSVPVATAASVSSATTGFCANLSADETKISTGMTSRINTMTTDRSNAATKLAQDRSTFDAQVQTNRANWDAARQKNFTALEQKATTTTEQQAVQTFEQTVLADVQTHRSTIDSARDTFRAAEDQTITNRQNLVNTAVTTFQGAVASAESVAQSGCASSTAGPTVRATFVASMKQARISYQTAIAAVPKLDPSVSMLAATRTAAVKAADTTFVSQVEAAGKTLKTALHQ